MACATAHSHANKSVYCRHSIIIMHVHIAAANHPHHYYRSHSDLDACHAAVVQFICGAENRAAFNSGDSMKYSCSGTKSVG